jgi:DNA-binding transcriptional LysR family regulator
MATSGRIDHPQRRILLAFGLERPIWRIAMDRLKALEVFRAIVEHKGFSRGADALNICHSNATRVVQDLEAELGARLFIRTTRKVSLTPFGQCFFERATAVLGYI